MEKKKFHIGDILSITTGRLVSNRHIDGVYDILNFMTGDNLFTHQLPRAAEECRPSLIGQFPQFESTEMNFAVADLAEMLKTASGREDTGNLLNGWLVKIFTGQYGLMLKCDEWLEVESLPKQDHVFKNPIMELQEMLSEREV